MRCLRVGIWLAAETDNARKERSFSVVFLPSLPLDTFRLTLLFCSVPFVVKSGMYCFVCYL